MKAKAALLADIARTQRPFLLKETRLQTFAPDFHFHDECQLVLIAAGKGRRVIGDSIATFTPGELTFVGPNVPHVWHSEPALDGAMAESVVLYLHPQRMLDALRPLVDTAALAVFFQDSVRNLSIEGGKRMRIQSLLARMRKEDELMQLASALQICQELLSPGNQHWLCTATSANAYSSKSQARVRRVMRFIRENFRDQITLAGAADHAGMQVHAFCRFFKGLTHRTFSDFLNEVRVEHACELLRQSDAPVTSVAYECGFNNLSYFNRTFKRLQGVTPSRFRETLGDRFGDRFKPPAAPRS